MPTVPFTTLPDSARVWVFGSHRPLADDEAARLIVEVEEFLARWHAHGTPLYNGYDWRDQRFLTIAVDQSTVGASGCSIDGLYRSLRTLEDSLGTSILEGGLVFYREGESGVAGVSRPEFRSLAAEGRVGPDTSVFDLSVENLGEWRERFEAPASDGWHASLLRRR